MARHRRTTTLATTALCASIAAPLALTTAPAASAAPEPTAGSTEAQAAAERASQEVLETFGLTEAPIDALGRPSQEILDAARDFARNPQLPLSREARNAILSAVAFFEGGNGGGVEVPQDGPPFTQFAWPTVSGSCIGGELDSVGSAIAVAGPAEIPAPGAGDGQTAFVFTSLGTAPALAEQGGMRVHWFNIDTLGFDTTDMGANGINPDGPATLSGVADTGKGRIIAVVEGAVNTESATCSYLPTAAFIDAR